MENALEKLTDQRSSEDQDLLERSTKKSKRDVGDQAAHAERTLEVVPETPMDETGECDVPPERPSRDRPPLSFRDAVAGNMMANIDLTLGDLEGDDCYSDDENQDEPDDPLCPTIRLTRKEKEIIRAPWRQALIVKVWGKQVGYSFLMRKLCALWRSKGSFEMVAIDNGYFLVKFGSTDDINFAKYEGPWMILDHYLIVKEWEPNFDPMADKTQKVLRRFLRKIGDKIGRPVRVDHATSHASRGRFARICVEVEITKPLLSKFTLEGRRRFIAYEGLHLVCFQCGMYGHYAEACPTMKNTGASSEPEQSRALVEKAVATKAAKVADTALKPYGSWIVVTKPERRRQQKPDQSRQRKDGPPGSHSQSRYKPLGILQEDDSLDGEAAEESTDADGGRPTDKAGEQDGGRNTIVARTQRRANMVVNEKQIENQKETRQTKEAKGKEKVA
ncbi:PREDICTED: uncharacterized protein LOC109157058 [Ipomoea nil]|uniref:uncharacterized protein LOC109157058 n=1 Tax=Ipomoea nil TaxID=35883 RepID=UPI000901F545|nr:PREDICTED: uncharacterized protein LOC109157058 [Ipomoea nil]